MKYLGLDLGSRTLGVAISDELMMFARNLTTIRFEEDDYEKGLEELLKIIEKEKITGVVLGNPKHMNGDEGIRSQISYKFKEMLEEKSNVKVYLMDERLTTVRVDKAMLENDLSRKKRHEKKDELAAVIILQDFLDGGLYGRK